MKYLGPPQSGSVADQTASRNRYGQYFRDRVQPDQTSTPRRAVARGDFGAAVSAWRALTDDQRLAWNAWAELHPRKNSLGRVKVLSGQTAFISGWLLTFRDGGGLITDPPAGQPSFVLRGIEIASPASNLEFSWDLVSLETINIWATEGQSSGVMSAPGKKWWIALTNLAPVTLTGTIDLTAAYTALIGAPVTGQAVFFRASTTSEGVRSPFLTARCVVS